MQIFWTIRSKVDEGDTERERDRDGEIEGDRETERESLMAS